MNNFRLTLIYLFLFLILQLIIINNIYSQEKEYVCFPCGAECDNRIHKNTGFCSDCNMDLIEMSRVKFQNYSPEKVAKILSFDNDVLLLDVRTPDEFNCIGEIERFSYGHLKNAVNIPSYELTDRINEILNYKDKEIIVYCSHGSRSPYACQQLTDLGFTNVKNMSEGLSVFITKNLVNIDTGESLIEK